MVQNRTFATDFPLWDIKKCKTEFLQHLHRQPTHYLKTFLGYAAPSRHFPLARHLPEISSLYDTFGPPSLTRYLSDLSRRRTTFRGPSLTHHLPGLSRDYARGAAACRRDPQGVHRVLPHSAPLQRRAAALPLRDAVEQRCSQSKKLLLVEGFAAALRVDGRLLENGRQLGYQR